MGRAAMTFMSISCLAIDYDGTRAHDGLVDDPTADGLVAFWRSGRKLLFVTGREPPDLPESTKPAA
jgi:hydroxymethylpyrimidine pyrophosphatase-like HAD family hydrolase